jgi:hypothetical protein
MHMGLGAELTKAASNSSSLMGSLENNTHVSSSFSYPISSAVRDLCRAFMAASWLLHSCSLTDLAGG